MAAIIFTALTHTAPIGDTYGKDAQRLHLHLNWQDTADIFLRHGLNVVLPLTPATATGWKPPRGTVVLFHGDLVDDRASTFIAQAKCLLSGE